MGTLLGDRDMCYFDRIAREVNRLAGTTIKYYALLQSNSPKDPLYGEPIEEEHAAKKYKNAPGICMDGFIEYPDPSYKATDGGLVIEYDAKIWIARSTFEIEFKNPDYGTDRSNPVMFPFRTPQIGDIIECQTKFFDLLKIELEGQENDTIRSHTMYLLTVKHRTTFDARRRIQEF